MREATTKSASQRDKILTWLRMRGAQGVLNTELNTLCMRFGARIWELRKAGHDIKTEKLDESRFRFVLVEDRQAILCPTPPVAQVANAIAEGERERLAHEYRKQASLFA